jgi:hypothetical protein
MTKKIVFVVALALVIVGIAAPSASAACNPPKFTGTYNSLTGGFAYWHTTIVGGSLTARMWSGAIDYTGSCNGGASELSGSPLYFGLDPQNVGLHMSLGDGCVPGCPGGSLSVKASVTSSDGSSQEFVASAAPETPGGGLNFDFSNNGHNMVSTPRPRVGTNSGRVGPTVVVSTLAEPLGGYFDGTDTQVLSCNFRQASAPSDPGRNASAYPTLLSTTSASGGSCASANLTVDCSNVAQDAWVVIQTVTAAGPDATVGPATRVKCNPALAQPKIKVNPKKAGVSNNRNN